MEQYKQATGIPCDSVIQVPGAFPFPQSKKDPLPMYTYLQAAQEDFLADPICCFPETDKKDTSFVRNILFIVREVFNQLYTKSHTLILTEESTYDSWILFTKSLPLDWSRNWHLQEGEVLKKKVKSSNAMALLLLQKTHNTPLLYLDSKTEITSRQRAGLPSFSWPNSSTMPAQNQNCCHQQVPASNSTSITLASLEFLPTMCCISSLIRV